MRTIKTNGKELIVVPVASEAESFNVYENELQYHFDDTISHIDLPKGDFEILGTLTDGKADFDVEPYVERIVSEGMDYYWNYLDLGFFFGNSKDSFLSLLQSHSIEYANKKLIFLLKK